jgi:multidrug efflux pump subunit AcrB
MPAIADQDGVPLYVRDIAGVGMMSAREQRDACLASDETGEDVLVGTVYAGASNTLELREMVERVLAALSGPQDLSLVVLPRTRPVALGIDAPGAEPRTLTSAIGKLAGVVAVVGERARGHLQLHVVPRDDDARGELLPLVRASYRSAYLLDDPVIQVFGERAGELEAIVHGLAHTPGLDIVGEVGTSARSELHAEVDRARCAEYGVDDRDVAIASQALLAGYRLASHIVLRISGGERAVDRVFLTGRDAAPVSLGSVLVNSERAGAEIRREDGRRWTGVRVRNDLDAARAAVRGVHVPTGYEVRLATGVP